MSMKTTATLAAAAAAFGATAALAETPAGIAADPYTYENRQPAPSPTNPTDPATGNSPGARVPTSPPGTGPAPESAEVGESASPAGNAADPYTYENRQPAPSPTNPTDPATGNSPEARVPTSPPGTGPSSP
jgi:hypothetical protein